MAYTAFNEVLNPVRIADLTSEVSAFLARFEIKVGNPARH